LVIKVNNRKPSNKKEGNKEVKADVEKKLFKNKAMLRIKSLSPIRFIKIVNNPEVIEDWF
jgi:hypothetical protein